MEKQKVTFIELPVFSGVVPLASGYIEAYSRKDPEIEASFAFEKISLPVDTPYAEILSRLKQSDADVYAFSCYVWNTRLVHRLLDELLLAKPQSFYVLGGPQVMHQGARYLRREHDNVFICNGEGERIFNAFLRTLLSPARDFSVVNGLSFHRDDELITTSPEPRIGDLSEVPSPFLEGMFDDLTYTWMLIETNRGCPFKCNYCYWGAAIGAKVYKYDQERLAKELEWISKSGCWYLMFADANWGMLPRDVDLTRLLVQLQKQHGSPASVYFAGSKNTPERVSEITRIFHEAGMLACQSVALQTINPETLKRVNRANIKTSAYTKVQQSLNERDIPSFVELIWPLPGETLASFQEGLATLCKIGADSFVVYPLLLMNNVELAQKREEYGLVTISDPDLCSEAEVVIQSNEVSTEAYLEGVRYAYGVTSLYSLRGLWYLGRYLNDHGIMEYSDLFCTFVQFARRQTAHPWAVFCDRSITSMKYIAFTNNGALVHLVLHSERETFDELLEEFVTAQDFWRDPVAQFLFEVDLVNRPYIYRNTRILPKRHQFKYLSVNTTPDSYIVDVPQAFGKEFHEIVSLLDDQLAANRFELRHRRTQLPFMPSKPLTEHHVYCQDASQRMRTLTPLWQKMSTLAAAI